MKSVIPALLVTSLPIVISIVLHLRERRRILRLLPSPEDGDLANHAVADEQRSRRILLELARQFQLIDNLLENSRDIDFRAATLLRQGEESAYSAIGVSKVMVDLMNDFMEDQRSSAGRRRLTPILSPFLNELEKGIDKLKMDQFYGIPYPRNTAKSWNLQIEVHHLKHLLEILTIQEEIGILEGHTDEVIACAWSPSPLLASGSRDSTARIWTVADGNDGFNLQNGASNVHVLNNELVTTIDWNGDGTLLATGSYDGQARIWSRNGELKRVLSKHEEPIHSMKWSKNGDYLLTGSRDKTAIVWDMTTYEWKQQFSFHSDCLCLFTRRILDVDWRNDDTFATSSEDHMIYVCKIGESSPIKTFSGHQGAVTGVRWDPTGSLLASCSGDTTAKIWSVNRDKHIHDLRGHSEAIYTIRWSPTGPSTINPNQKLVLASASHDSTVKIWNVDKGKMLQSLNGHRKVVYTLAFSPNGEYLASGSLDKFVHIWSLKQRKAVKTYNCKGTVYKVCWNKEGDKIAASTGNHTVCVMDFRM